MNEESSAFLDVADMVVLHHGEVQTTGGMFRKRQQYLVLTNTHLLRFKNQGKASEVFPCIPASLGRSNTTRHSRISSIGSMHELQISTDSHQAIALNQVVAVYKLDDGRPYFSIDVAVLDELSNRASTMTLQLNDPRESDLWLSSMRAAITNLRLMDPLPFKQKTVEHVARALEQEFDYEPQQFRMFKIVQRASKSGSRSSSDDLAKLTSNICYLAIGVHKVHLVPLPKSSKPASSTSLSDLTGESFGIATLTSLCVQSFDDAFQLAFRLPLRQPSLLYLASSTANDIVLCIRQTAEFIRPEWLELPFKWNVPPCLEDDILPTPSVEGDDYFQFDRTLTAYCVGYGVDPSNIRYTVNYDCEDAPKFELLTPAHPQRSKYALLELLAVMRALRYNETFRTIAFSGVNMEILHDLYDPHGSELDHLLLTTRSGSPISIPQQAYPWLIVQEVQALALKSKRLRRLDFSHCLTRKPTDVETGRDRGCGICEALFPLCARQLTNVDWITLTGITLAEIDVDYIYAASIEKACHLRAIELGRCGLTEKNLKTIMQGVSQQETTLESIDISGNMARLSSETLNSHLSRFQHIRKLNVSNMPVNAGSGPLIAAETFLKWRLEELALNGIRLNDETLGAISTYLSNPQSGPLRHVRLNQCSLTGKAVAILLRAMATGYEGGRELHLYVSENSLEQQHEMLVDTIGWSMTPTRLTMQMLEYKNEKNFQALVNALSRNRTLTYLDISQTSLPFDANAETCSILKDMLERNSTLEELNISGEQSHLEAVILGSGLSNALKGLAKNRRLQILRIEHQSLGLPGAGALALVLEKNETLREIYCEDNEINLQAFTVLVNAVNHNTSLLYLPNMDKDRMWSRKKVDREVDSLRETNLPPSAKTTVKRTLGAAMAGGRSISYRATDKPSAPIGYTEQDMQAAVGSLVQKWDFEVERLQSYLRRNYCLAHGLPVGETPAIPHAGDDRPPTGGSLATALRDARRDRTPTAEVDLQLGDAPRGEIFLEKMDALGLDDSSPGTESPTDEYSEKQLEWRSEGEELEKGLMMGKAYQ